MKGHKSKKAMHQWYTFEFFKSNVKRGVQSKVTNTQNLDSIDAHLPFKITKWESTTEPRSR